MSLECRLRQIIELSERARIILGDVIAIHIQDDLFSNPERFHIDLLKYRPVGRLFGTKYMTVTDNIVELGDVEPGPSERSH